MYLLYLNILIKKNWKNFGKTEDSQSELEKESIIVEEEEMSMSESNLPQSRMNNDVISLISGYTNGANKSKKMKNRKKFMKKGTKRSRMHHQILKEVESSINQRYTHNCFPYLSKKASNDSMNLLAPTPLLRSNKRKTTTKTVPVNKEIKEEEEESFKKSKFNNSPVNRKFSGRKKIIKKGKSPYEDKNNFQSHPYLATYTEEKQVLINKKEVYHVPLQRDPINDYEEEHIQEYEEEIFPSIHEKSYGIMISNSENDKLNQQELNQLKNEPVIKLKLMEYKEEEEEEKDYEVQSSEWGEEELAIDTLHEGVDPVSSKITKRDLPIQLQKNTLGGINNKFNFLNKKL